MRLYIKSGSRYVDFGDWFEPNATPTTRINQLYQELVDERDRTQAARDALEVARRENNALRDTLKGLRSHAENLSAALEACRQEAVLRETIKPAPTPKRDWLGRIFGVL